MQPSVAAPPRSVSRGGRSRARSRLFRAILVLVASPLLAFLLLEGLLRIIGNPDFHGIDYVVEDTELQWANAPGIQSEIVGFDYRFTISFNSLGLRGPEPRADASERILLLGDSYMLGLGANDGETIAAHLQAQLDAAAPRRFDVANGGVSGYGAQQAMRLARRHWDRLRPTIVVWVHCGNDFSDDWNFMHGSWGALRSQIPGRRFMLENSVAWSLLKPGALAVLDKLSIRRNPIKLEGTDEMTLVSDLGARWAAGRDLTFGGIDELDQLRRERSARMFVTSVGFVLRDVEERFSRDARVVRDHCREKGVPFTGPPRAATDDEFTRWVNPSSIGHWTSDGNRWFATSLFDAMRAAGVF